MKNNNGAAIRRLSERSLKNSRMRNLFAMLAIVLTGVLFTAVFSLVGGIMQISQEDTMREVGGKFHAGLKEATRAQYEKVITDPLIEDYTYNIFIGMADNIVKHQAELRYLPEEKYLADMFITLEEGHLPVGRNEIVVDTFILDDLGLPHALGEKVPIVFTFQGKKVEEEFTVCGYYQGDHIAHASELFLSESYWNELKGSLTDEDFLKWGEEHPEDNGVGLMAVNLYFHNDSNLEEKVRTVIANAGYEPETEIRYGVNWAYMSSRMESIDPLSVIVLTAVILIILVTGYLIIYNIFQISVVSDIRFYGLLKTIGTTKKQIRRLVRRQAAVLSAVGIPIGLITGYGVGKLILPFATRLGDYGNASTSLKFNPWIFVFSAAFSAFTVSISCRKPGKIAGSVSPVEAVKYAGTEEIKAAGKRKKRRNRFSAVSMAFANLGRNKRSAITVIAAVSFSMILLAVITTAVNSFRMDEYMEQRIVGDYMLGDINITGGTFRSGDIEIEPEYLALADSRKGVEGRNELWVWYGSRLLMDEQAREQFRKLDAEGKLRRGAYNNEAADKMLSGEEQNMAGFFYGYSEELLRNLRVLEGTLDVEKFLTGDYILLNCLHCEENLPAAEHAYHPGDKVTVESITEDSIVHEITNENGELIDAVYENLASKEYEVMAIVDIPYSMNMHLYTANACDAVLPISEFNERGRLFAVSYQVADEYQKDFEAAVREYSEAHTEMGYVSKDSLRKEFENMIAVVGMLGIALCAIIALIGMLNFVNAVVTEIVSRKREFAMLQSIGMTNGQLRKMLICEGISYVAVSGVISFLIGSPLSWLVLNAMNKILLFFDYRFQILPFLIMIPMLLFVAVFAPLMAYRNLKKKSIVERLRETE